MATPSRNTQPYGALAVPGRLRLVVVSGACPEGLSFSIGAPSASIGRGKADVALNEATQVSEKHATIKSGDGRASVVDEGSTNGVYVRLRVPHTLHDGDWFRVGAQFFRFHVLKQEESYPSADGTLLFVSPRRKGTFMITQVLAGGQAGQSATTSGDELTIGGEGSTVAFTSDTHLSTKHARVYQAANGAYMLEDLGSTNGTYVRVRGEMPVAHGDYLFVGSELLRVEIT